MKSRINLISSFRIPVYILSFIGIVVILYFGRGLFIPLSFSLFISFILYPVCIKLESKGVSKTIAIVLSLFGLLTLSALLIMLLIQQLYKFSRELPAFKEYINESMQNIGRFLSERFGLTIEWQDGIIDTYLAGSGSEIINFLQRTISVSTVSIVLAILVPIFSYLILYHRKRWIDSIYYLFPDQGREKIRNILKLTVISYYNFIKGMILVYLVVGTLNSIGLLIIGVPSAFLFGFLASIFTIIPYVGIIVASLLPITIAWITFQSVWYPIAVIAVFAFVQYLEAYIIFPLAVSQKLKINTFVTLAIIIAGGIIWGIAGMILFIPYLGIIKLIADRTPELKFISVFLGSD